MEKPSLATLFPQAKEIKKKPSKSEKGQDSKSETSKDEEKVRKRKAALSQSPGRTVSPGVSRTIRACTTSTDCLLFPGLLLYRYSSPGCFDSGAGRSTSLDQLKTPTVDPPSGCSPPVPSSCAPWAAAATGAPSPPSVRAESPPWKAMI